MPSEPVHRSANRIAVIALAALIALAAFGCRRHARRPISNQPPSAPLAALFADGRALRYRILSTEHRADPADTQRDEELVDCRIEARQLGTWQVARIRCTVDSDNALLPYLAALYLFDGHTLWHAVEIDAPATTAAAAAITRSPGTMVVGRIPGTPGPWCLADRERAADGESYVLCVAADRGVTRVSHEIRSEDGRVELEETIDLLE